MHSDDIDGQIGSGILPSCSHKSMLCEIAGVLAGSFSYISSVLHYTTVLCHKGSKTSHPSKSLEVLTSCAKSYLSLSPCLATLFWFVPKYCLTRCVTQHFHYAECITLSHCIQSLQMTVLASWNDLSLSVLAFFCFVHF